MSFLSLNFAVFLAAALLLFYLAPSRLRRHILLAISIAFYLSWGAMPALLLFGTAAVVYAAGLAVERWRGDSERQGLLVTLGVVLGLLFVLTAFKCGPWVASVAETLLGPGVPHLAVLMVAPLGLSYYLFKLIGYLVDVYWEKIPTQRSLLSFLLYVTFFPQMVCGPIQRAEDFFEQLDALEHPRVEDITTGLRRILFGVFKKLVIADGLAGVVAAAHADPADRSTLELLGGAYLFVIQLYADFSGISDIAIGLGLLFGVKAPENFDLPFAARNVQEYWRRWHISLSSWLGDYLFVPLRMALRRLGQVGLVIAIFVNMIAIGLWHAPTWCNAAYGVTIGVYMVVSALTLSRRNAFFRRRPALAKLRALTAPLVTFHLMVFALIIFRAGTIPGALTYVRHLFLPTEGVDPLRWSISDGRMAVALPLGFAVVMEAVEITQRNPRVVGWFGAAPRPARWALYYVVILAVLVYGSSAAPSFIYEQF